ncbi:hypothetical protein CLOM_g23646 [Closterium sp. NIES-68]|nr:hypothetical protein CLOM_g23646 [Closterium sp. NIES-68]GJP86864.1 hypothetical protein CLOP_g16838 [Closterium sp. NIES-67]
MTLPPDPSTVTSWQHQIPWWLTLVPWAGIAAGTLLLAYRLVYAPYRIVRQCKKQGIPFLPFKPFIGQALDLYSPPPPSAPPSPDQPPPSDFPSSPPSPDSPPSTHGPAVFIPRLHEWRQQYGDVVGFTVGGTVQLLVTDPSLVRQVLLSSSGRYTKTAGARKALRLLGKGLPLSEGSLWAKQRRIVNPAFRPAAIKEMVGIMDQQGRLLAHTWQAQMQQQNVAQGEGLSSTSRDSKEGRGEGGQERAYIKGASMEVDVQESMSSVALDVIGLAAFGSTVMHEGGKEGGQEYGEGKEDGRLVDGEGGRENRERVGKADAAAAYAADAAPDPVALYNALSKLAELGAKMVFSWRSLVPCYDILPLPENFALWAAETKIRNLTLHLIGKRRAALHGQGGSTGRAARDLLALMLAAHDEAGNEQMTDQQLVDECITFLLAGHGTTARLLTWTFYLLAKHPDWQERLRAELKEALTQQRASDASAGGTAAGAGAEACGGDAGGGKGGGEAGERVTWEVVAALKAMGMVLNESLRMFPPVSFIGRTCQQTCRLGPYDVPRGTDVLIPIAMLHYDSRFWGDDALDFNPNRFAKGPDEACSHPQAFLPFGSGPRICIGNTFALTEAKVVLAHILRQFSWRLSPAYKHFPISAVTLRAGFGMHLIVEPLANPF